MKLTEIILDNFAPQNLRALWLQPKADNTVAFKVFNNGMWMNTFEWEDHSEYLTQPEADKLYNPLLNYSNGVEAIKVDGNILKLLDENGNTVIAVDSAGNSYIILGWSDQENILIEPSQVSIRNNGVNALNINASNRTLFYNNGNRAIRIRPTALNLSAPSTEDVIVLSDAYTSIFGPDGVRQGLVISKNNHTVTLGNSEDSTKIEDKVFTQKYAEDGIVLTNRSTSQVFTIPYNINTLLVNGLAKKADNFTVGTGLEMTPERVLNVTLDITVFKVVDALPESPAAGDENKIFLVPAESTGTNNAYTEHLWVNSAWEELGQYISEVDLTPYLRISDAQSTYATKTELTAHTGNTSNPHNVTKAQVGLGNVDNTSDANKPVSTAQQAAIDAVDNKTAVYTTVPTLSADYTIPANATTREYIYEITIGATTYNVTAAEGIKWIDNNLPLVEANSKLIVSVVNNIAVWGTVYE